MKVYNEKSLVNISNSILKHFGAETFHETIPEIDKYLNGHKKVVAVLFDGMGQNIVRMHLNDKSFIRSHYVTTINSTFPPTTSAATTSFLTGKYPIENGWLGWNEYFEEFDSNVILFKNTDYNTGEKLPQIDGVNIANKYFPITMLFNLIKQYNKKANAYGFFRYPIDPNGPKYLDQGAKQLKKFLSENEECFAYFYWDSPDREMHEYGIKSWKVKNEVHKAQKFLKKVVSQNPDTLFIFLADHGHVNVKYLDICDHPDLYALLRRKLTLEKRTVGMFVKEGQEKQFVKLFNKYYSEYFELLSRDDVLKNKVFGNGSPAPGSLGVFGDYIAVAKREYALVAKSELHNPDLFPGHHAGGTKEERLIDVSIFNK